MSVHRVVDVFAVLAVVAVAVVVTVVVVGPDSADPRSAACQKHRIGDLIECRINNMTTPSQPPHTSLNHRNSPAQHTSPHTDNPAENKDHVGSPSRQQSLLKLFGSAIMDLCCPRPLDGPARWQLSRSAWQQELRSECTLLPASSSVPRQPVYAWKVRATSPRRERRRSRTVRQTKAFCTSGHRHQWSEGSGGTRTEGPMAQQIFPQTHAP
jgi:hypothetical protein